MDAENVCRTYVADPESAASVKVCTYGKMLEKAIKVLKCEEPEQIPGILNGAKSLRSFTASWEISLMFVLMGTPILSGLVID